MSTRPMDQCVFCGETRAGGFGGPHAVHPCPVLQREHEARLKALQHESGLRDGLERIAEAAETKLGADAAEGRALGEIAELARRYLGART